MKILSGNTQGLEDVSAFLDETRRFFEGAPGTEVVITRAPGRLDLMGGIADYSGSQVLQWPLQEATCVALGRTSQPLLRIVSRGGGDARSDEVIVPIGALWSHGAPIAYPAVRALFGRVPQHAWATYVIGVFVVLAHERKLALSGGVDLLIHSTVPEGKGVSSSAALEVAVMRAVTEAFAVPLDGPTLALYAQKVENQVVGAPCGLMDQMTSACGRARQLLSMVCQPANVGPHVRLPADLGVWGIDSGIRHAVGGGDYGSVRAAAFMGYRLIAGAAGFAVRPDPARSRGVHIDDPRFGGYLANVTPAAWTAEFEAAVPGTLLGRTFLARWDGTTDPQTNVNPERTYLVRAATRHPIFEHARVGEFARHLALCPEVTPDRARGYLGKLMYASHESYTACGLGSAGTDRLVAMVREAGAAAGLFGAKITGGGSGGTVAVLGHRAAGGAVRAIAEAYAKETGHPARVFEGSSPGAMDFGALRVKVG
jgi:L-arabinokinase